MKTFLQYLRESKKQTKGMDWLHLKSLLVNKPEYLEIMNTINFQPTLEDRLKYYKIKNYTIREDGETVDVEGDVDLNYLSLTEIPFKFGEVYGSFKCYDNKLTSLEGSPRIIYGNFNCRHNLLTTLEGGPEKVTYSYYCSQNPGKFTEEDVRKVCQVGMGVF